MSSILIQNMFNDHKNNGYLLACKPTGNITVGDYIILKENIEAKIIDIEITSFGTLIISVSKDFFSDPEINYDFLYKKEFKIRNRGNAVMR
jgi:intein/homing endonuclease